MSSGNKDLRCGSQTKQLVIDTANFYLEGVGREGISRAELAAQTREIEQAQRRVRDGSSAGLDAEFAALNLAHEMPAQLPQIQAMAADLRRHQDVLVIGIGGSSLGAKALQQALAPQPAMAGTPRLHFVENIDPYFLQRLLSSLVAESTAVLCISKSGGTIETVVQYLILRDWLTRQLGGNTARRHQWIITDPKNGWLRELAEREGLPSLPVPPRVGGRYSVLSPVGLVPLAVLGVDIETLLQGAVDNAARCANADVAANPALEMAALSVLLDTRRSKRTAVMMPYVNRLQLFVDWYCQLWAESLGKWDRARPGSTPAGTLPVRAMGAVDQHSQLQMYLESRHDKFFTFIELETCEYDLPVPLDDFDAPHFPFLKGRSMAEVIDAEFRATRQVITDAGHPNMTIRLPLLNAHVLGQLIDLYQRTTIYAGLLYGINPLDQPSVETGKRLAIDYLRGTPR
ncbi:MAG: glucose-6-phosphate isomerase [Pseudomonadota bacterium]